MGFFKQVEGEAAVIVSNGVYKQCDLYERNGYLYAKVSGGFVRLMSDGSTTNAKTRLETLSWDGPIARDAMGKLCRPEVKGAIELEGSRAQLLLGGPAE